MGCHWLVLLVQVCGAVGSSLSGFEVLVRVPVWSAPELAPRNQKNLNQQQHHDLKHQQNQPAAPLPATRPRRLEPTPQSHNAATPASSAPPHQHTGPRRAMSTTLTHLKYLYHLKWFKIVEMVQTV